MKKLLLLSLTILSITINAQSVKLTFPTEQNPKLTGQYIVIASKGTAQENYQKVIEYINATYENPSKVIKSDLAGKYVRMEAYTSTLYRNIGFDLDGTYQLGFNFRQDKIKITYISSNNGTNDLNFTYSDLYKKNGKPKKQIIKYNTAVVDGLNIVIGEIATELKKEKTEDDW